MATTYTDVGDVTVTPIPCGPMTRWRIQANTVSGYAVLNYPPINAELHTAVFAAGLGYGAATLKSFYMYDALESDQLLGLCASKAIASDQRIVLYESVIASVQTRPLIVCGPTVLRFGLDSAVSNARLMVDLIGFNLG